MLLPMLLPLLLQDLLSAASTTRLECVKLKRVTVWYSSGSEVEMVVCSYVYHLLMKPGGGRQMQFVVVAVPTRQHRAFI